ncbi:MAG: uroporphyrinogen-III C-methyltransferase [Phototrophicaceae bacterium]
MSGKVYLVGAGPGDPDLITVKGLRLIRQADVILYDLLIPMSLLDDARPDAELVNVGKQPKKHRFSQDEINRLIVDYATRGLTVVRLKGGDPLVFGRGSEEALACRAAGIPFEIVPGVSSAFAVPAYAGIPLTHRNVSTSFTVFTGHEDPTKPEASVNYSALAQLDGTLVILMGVNQLGQISAELIAAGMPADKPAAIIQTGTTDAQRTVIGTLGTLPDLALAAEIRPPATIVIGEVVALREMGVAWFTEAAVLELP